MPRRTISCSLRPVISWFLNLIEPSETLRPAADQIEHGGLAGAVRADDDAQLALVDVEVELVDRLEAVEGDADVLEREQEIGVVGHGAVSASFRRRRAGLARGGALIRQLPSRGHDLIGHQAGEPARERQHDRDEQAAHGEQPEFRERSRRSSVLPQLTSSVPTTAPTSECRPPTAQKITISIDGTMPTNDGDMKPTCSVNIAPPTAAMARRQAEDEDLEVGDVVAGEPHAVLLVAHRHQDAAELARDDEAREEHACRAAGSSRRSRGCISRRRCGCPSRAACADR